MRVHTKIIWDRDGELELDDWFSYAGPISLAGGGSSQKSVQQTSTGPWTAQQPYIMRGFQEAEKLYNSGTPQYFPDSTIAPQSADTSGAIQQMGQGSSLPGDAAAQVSKTLGGAYDVSPEAWAARTYNPNANAFAGTSQNANAGTRANVGFNPYLTQGMNDYIGNVTNAVTRSVVPRVNQGFAAAGRTGESPLAQTAMARGIADAVAPYQFNSAEAEMGRRFSGGESLAGRAQSASENQAQRIYGAGESQAAREQGAKEALSSRQFNAGENALSRGMSAYESERGRQLGAAGLAPELTRAQYIPAEAQLQAGQLQDERAQQELQAEIERFNFGQNLPQQKLNDYLAQVAGMNYGQAGTNVGKANAQSSPADTFMKIGQGIGGIGGGLGK